ncbi:MAG TPA: hypothetical protein PLF25_11355, partial [Accumulibacter sp.]|nr:hypothetical protein [Accumulibacter sp.]
EAVLAAKGNKRIAISLLPKNLAWRYAQIERFGFVILLALLASGILGWLLDPLIHLIGALVEIVFQIRI